MNEAKLREIFSRCGQVRSVKIKKPQIWNQNIQMSGTSTSYGIAYVDFSREEEAERAIQELNGI